MWGFGVLIENIMGKTSNSFVLYGIIARGSSKQFLASNCLISNSLPCITLARQVHGDVQYNPFDVLLTSATRFEAQLIVPSEVDIELEFHV